jgi:hypothetical protein
MTLAYVMPSWLPLKTFRAYDPQEDRLFLIASELEFVGDCSPEASVNRQKFGA